MKNKQPTNYRHWAFRLFIYVILLNILLVYIEATSTHLVFNTMEEPTTYSNTEIVAMVAGLLANLLFLAGIVFTTIMWVKKEPKDYKWYTATIGYPIFTMTFMGLTFYSFFAID